MGAFLESITEPFSATLKSLAFGKLPAVTLKFRVANSPVWMPLVLTRARVTAATLFELVIICEPTPAPVAETSGVEPLGSDVIVSPDDGVAVTVTLRAPMVVPAGSVPVVRNLTATWVGWLVNVTVRGFEVTGVAPTVALATTSMAPATVLFRMTDATPPFVLAVADERVPLPLRMVNVTGVPS